MRLNIEEELAGFTVHEAWVVTDMAMREIADERNREILDLSPDCMQAIVASVSILRNILRNI